MNPLNALQVVNDLALAMVGENEPAALARGFMQRLLYHTGFTTGLLLERAGGDLVLSHTIGNRELARRAGTPSPWARPLIDGPSGFIADLHLDPSAFMGAERYLAGLRLCASPEVTIVLLGPTAPAHGPELPALFEALLPRFAQAYAMCCERVRHQLALTGEIEQRRHAETEFRASEERSRALLELSPQAIAVIDLGQRKPTFVNARFRELAGLAPDALPVLTEWWRKTFPDPGYRREARQTLRERVVSALSKDGVIEPLTLLMTGPDGIERFVEVHAHLAHGEAIVSMVDITERRRHEDVLRAAKETAERASTAKSNFLSSISHELRTPLNAILGFAQLLEADDRAAPVHRGHAREILESGHHLLALVDDVLDLTRIESGRVSVTLGTVLLEEVLGECLTLVEGPASTRGVSIVFEGDVAYALHADATRVRQVLINLLSNAVKYNLDGGRVTVGAEVIGERRVQVRVSDTGPGIPSDRLSELFQPFNRLGAEGSRVQGTGIGLVVAKQLLELMGGSIGVESEMGRGSTFWFELPLASDAADAAPRARTGAQGPRTIQRERGTGPLRKPRILVAEDHPMNQRLLALQLDQAGTFDVVLAPHGAQALDRWQKGDIDLLLTDCNMPHVDGYALAAAIRERERLTGEHLPIIAVTASAMKEDIERCLAEGMDACLAKPLSVGALSEALEKWLPRGATWQTPEDRAAAHRREPRRLYLKAVEAMLGPNGKAHAQKVVDDFVLAAEGTIESARNALGAENVEEVGRAMHKLRPTAKLCGAVNLAMQAQALEAAATAGSLSGVRELWPLLESAWEAVQADLVKRPVPAAPSPRTTPVSGTRPRPRDWARLRGLRALVIDDDAFTARYVSDLLTGFGLSRVLVAEDGRAGLELVREGGPTIDLILCDLAMPGMDGVELLRHLQVHEFQGSFVFMSGADSRVLDSVDELARQHGFSVLGTLMKPFGADALAALLGQHRPVVARRSRDTRLLQVDAEDLERAIEGGELTVHLQPKVRADNLAVVGVEALARWFRPDGSSVPPVTFVKVAEAHGLADPLFYSVFEQSLAATRRLQRAGHAIKVAVNVSAQSLARLEIAEYVLATTERMGLDPKDLVLEVTETGLVRDLRVALDVLTRLRLHGIGLSIDDFGTGYSTIDLLRRVPFTELKIDRSFVSNAVRDPSARHIIASSVGLARGLRLRTVAEGVETEAELQLVREVGCDELQGYLFARPMAEAALATWLGEWTGRTPPQLAAAG